MAGLQRLKIGGLFKEILNDVEWIVQKEWKILDAALHAEKGRQRPKVNDGVRGVRKYLYWREGHGQSM